MTKILRVAEDYNFFVNVIQKYSLANLQESLYFYRRYTDSVTIKDPQTVLKNTSLIIKHS